MTSKAAGAAHGATFLVTYQWYCPNCKKEAVTHDPRPHAELHVCPKARYMAIPMLRKGQAGKIEVLEREDYVGREVVTLDPERKRPVMAIKTTRDNGNDLMVHAPLAKGSLRGI